MAAAKAAKEQLEREESEEKARIEAAEKVKRESKNTTENLVTEIQNELNELRKQLNATYDEDEEVDEVYSNKLIIGTLRTAVAEGWTKTMTIQELRKSTGMTLKKAREYTTEVFGNI